MVEPAYSVVLLLARICLATLFLVSGVHKALCYQKAVTEFVDSRVPAVGIFLPLTIVLHLVASLALMLGIHTLEAACALTLFTVIATIKVHPFWRMSGADRLVQSRIALANLAIVGGLMLLAAVGPGRLVLA